MSLRDDLAEAISTGRDILGVHGIRAADLRTADAVLRLLAAKGIGHWNSATEPEDGQRVLIRLDKTWAEPATYDAVARTFSPTRSASHEEFPFDDVLAWMAWP
jgi:hypothetical protein